MMTGKENVITYLNYMSMVSIIISYNIILSKVNGLIELYVFGAIEL